MSKYNQEELGYYEEYSQVLEYDRNTIMADKVIEYLDSDDVHFYVVGSAHYYGDRGILALLKEKGYEAKEITY